MAFKESPIERTLLYIEPGPVLLVATNDGRRNNVMTVSWSISLDFMQHFAICTGPWNYSFNILLEQREAVIAVPAAEMAKTVVQIGDISGAQTDKFDKFGLTALPASEVGAPLIDEAIANIECRVVDYNEQYGLIVFEALKLWEKKGKCDRRLLHARGDGTFTADGESMNLRRYMKDEIPPGL